MAIFCIIFASCISREPRAAHFIPALSYLYNLLYFLHTQLDCDNFSHKCCQESSQSKCTFFPPHLTSASACTTWENRKPRNCIFSLKCCMLFHQKTRNTVKNITWSQLNHPSLSKRSTGCTRQDLGREHSILLSVTHMFCVSQVCHGVSCCAKGGSCSSSSLE